MKRLILPAVVLALSASALSIALSGPAWAQRDVVAQRKEEMKRASEHMEAIKKILDAGDPVAPVAARAEEIRGYYVSLPSLFPPGSTENSKARPAVWSDSAGFATASANSARSAAELASAATAGNRDATAAAFRELAASCGACHRTYRSR